MSLPLALGFAEGAAFRQSVGTLLIGGLVSSLVLTLVLIPAVYCARASKTAMTLGKRQSPGRFTRSQRWKAKGSRRTSKHSAHGRSATAPFTRP